MYRVGAPAQPTSGDEVVTSSRAPKRAKHGAFGPSKRQPTFGGHVPCRCSGSAAFADGGCDGPDDRHTGARSCPTWCNWVAATRGDVSAFGGTATGRQKTNRTSAVEQSSGLGCERSLLVS